ncbi:MAG: glycosyltransferase [Planctomycetia bacterium]|nr:glycosyltransferase [Planctomycetia bacterium]
MISFIVPAHNEEAHVGASLGAIHESARAVGEPYEVIVVDDASTDRTGEIATAAQARVIRVEYRHISATRNAGAREAQGEIFFFVDADTLVNTDAVRASLAALQQGAVAGGCLFRFDGQVPLWAKLIYPPGVVFSRCFKFVGGCCLFCHREAFFQAGGFSEDHYAGEEVGLIRAWKRQGRFVVPRPTVVTSGRKLRAHSLKEVLTAVGRAFVRQCGKPSKQREGLDLWYGERKPDMLAPTCDAST